MALRIENGVHVYTSTYIDLYGVPDVEKFMVIEEPEYSHPVSLSYFDQLQVEYPKPKNVHHYSRFLRFKTVLSQILGLSGFKTQKSLLMLENVHEQMSSIYKYVPPCLAWDKVHKILRDHKYQVFYNRVPAILEIFEPVSISFKGIITPIIFHKILNKFRKMDTIFNKEKKNLGRKYFPSLRFIALKLLDEYGIKLPITIPLTRTTARLTSLTNTYNLLMLKIDENDFDFFIDQACKTLNISEGVNS